MAGSRSGEWSGVGAVLLPFVPLFFLSVYGGMYEHLQEFPIYLPYPYFFRKKQKKIVANGYPSFFLNEQQSTSTFLLI